MSIVNFNSPLMCLLPGVGCIFKVLTEPGSIILKLVESVYFGSEFTRVKNMTCINNKFDLAL